LKLARVLGELADLLDAQGTPYAVVGGLAASALGEARFAERGYSLGQDLAEKWRKLRSELGE